MTYKKKRRTINILLFNMFFFNYLLLFYYKFKFILKQKDKIVKMLEYFEKHSEKMTFNNDNLICFFILYF